MEDNINAGVETRSCGNISSLISRFQNVNTMSQTETFSSSKFPAKKLKLDYQNMALEKSTTKLIGTSIVNHEAGARGKMSPINGSLPEVKLQFKMNTEATQLPQTQTENNVIIKQDKQFTVGNNITTKPLIMPKSFKDKNILEQPQQAANKTKETFHVKHSDLGNRSVADDISQSSRQHQSKKERNTGQDAHPSPGDSDRSSCVGVSDNAAVGAQKHDSAIFTTNPSQSDNKDRTSTTPILGKQFILNRVSTDKKAGIVISPSILNEQIQYTTEDVFLHDQGSEVTAKEVCVQPETHKTNAKYFIKTSKPENSAEHKQDVQVKSVDKHNQLANNSSSVKMFVNLNVNKTIHKSGLTEKVITTGLVNSEPGNLNKLSQAGLHNANLKSSGAANTVSVDEDGTRSSTSDVTTKHRLTKKYSDVSESINVKLGMLKSELMAMRKMDLVLLRQLINISQKMQRIQRADALRVSRSLSFLNPNKTMPRKCRPVERQNSAPHCADRMRFRFGNHRFSTEDDYRDSQSSMDESELDMSPSELEESTFSLNYVNTNQSRRNTFKSRDLLASLDIAEDCEESYEDILRRNIRLWKMSFMGHESVKEKVVVWF